MNHIKRYNNTLQELEVIFHDNKKVIFLFENTDVNIAYETTKKLTNEKYLPAFFFAQKLELIWFEKQNNIDLSKSNILLQNFKERDREKEILIFQIPSPLLVMLCNTHAWHYCTDNSRMQPRHKRIVLREICNSQSRGSALTNFSRSPRVMP